MFSSKQGFSLLTFVFILSTVVAQNAKSPRERTLLDHGWFFFRYDGVGDSLVYDVRPEVNEDIDRREADAKPVEGDSVSSKHFTLKSWILPTGNDFLKDSTKHHKRPASNPGEDFPFVQIGFNDSAWKKVSIPHDWAANGEFYKGGNVPVGGGMGRLPVQGVAWYRKKIDIPHEDQGKSIYLDIEGAMSYAMIWINGKLAGGWPYGYASFRIDLTPYIKYGESNQLAIRLDNPPSSSRWYPGAGLYRNVWLTKTNPIQVDQWGTFMKSSEVTKESAKLDFEVKIKNQSAKKANIIVATEVFYLGQNGKAEKSPVVAFEKQKLSLNANGKGSVKAIATLKNPKLWGPVPEQTPHRYVAITTVYDDKKIVDTYTTKFGVRDLRFDATKGVHVNGEAFVMKGANMHHDLGAIGTAFNCRAAERQLLMLQEAGANSIRLAHNPPATELLELTDSLGLLVIDEIFDNWRLRKTPLDFHLIFDDWYEQDIRAFIRRDRNHPSVIMWSYGNEVGEQYTGEEGAALSKELHDLVKEEDATRPTTVSMNFAKADMPFSRVADIISLNYQGEGIRNAPAYKHLKGINTPPSFPKFRELHPDKMIVSSENAAAVSSRGEYFFPVYPDNSAPVEEGQGGNGAINQVSSYELYSVPFGSSADKVFATTDAHPYVAGGFVWSGWDYLGEPTPYYESKSSYFGFIDLAGFKKDRFYLYQSYWRPDYPMAHILPHWNWEKRLNDTVPVHVFTSGDEAELFLNGRSLGRKKKQQYEYRIRWDDVVYEPGEVKVVAYKNGKEWASDIVKTTGAAKGIKLSADRDALLSDGKDLIFVTVDIVDESGLTVPRSKNELTFSLEGDGTIVATDNGDSNSLVSFASMTKKAFNGKALAIVKAKKDAVEDLTLHVKSDGLETGILRIKLTK